MSKKIPLDKMLHAIDNNDQHFYENLDEEQKKEWSAWLSMRYASSATGSDAYHYLLMVNSLVNVDFNTLRNHPDLQWKLLSLCGTGSKSFHPWIAPPKKGKRSKAYDFLLETYPQMNPKDVQDLCDILSKEELIQLCLESGLDKKQAKDIAK